MTKISHILYFSMFMLWVFISPKTWAQTSDFRSRLGIKATHETDLINSGIDLQGRLRGNSTIFQKLLIEPEVSYDLSENFKIGTSWRTELNSSIRHEISIRNRASAYVRYKINAKDFEIKLKTTLQYGVDELTILSTNNKLVNRNAIELSYNWFGKKWTPYSELEIFTHLNHLNGMIINQNRFTLGTSYKIKKSREIAFYYLFENEMNVETPIDSYIIGLIYKFKI